MLKVLSKVSSLFHNNIQSTEENKLLSLFSMFEDSSPAYLINENFDLLWSNQGFINVAYNPEKKKCYEALFGRESICANCPSVIAFEKKQLAESYVTHKKEHGKSSLFKIVSQFAHLDGQSCAVNFVHIELSPPKSKQHHLEDGSILAEKLKAYQDGFVQFLQDAPLPFLLLTSDMRIIFANKYFLSRFYSTDVSQNENVFELKDILKFQQPEEYDNLIVELANKGQVTFKALLQNKRQKIDEPIDCYIQRFQHDGELYLMFFKELNLSSNEIISPTELFHIFESILDEHRVGIQISDSFNRVLYKNKIASKILESKDLQNDVQKLQISGGSPLIMSSQSPNGDSNKEFLKIVVRKFSSKQTGESFNILEFEDVTQLENLRNQLVQYQIQLSQIEKYVNYLSFTIDSDYRLSRISSNSDNFWGIDLALSDDQGKNFLDMIYSDDQYKVLDVLTEVFHFPNLSKSISFRIKKPGEENFWVKGVFENVLDSRGKIHYVNCILFDINEQKKVEEQLKASQEEMRKLALYFESLREEEKKKLAFEIHDELGHLLTAMKLEMSWILKKKYLREEILHERLMKLIEMVETTIRKVRSISSQLRPSILDHFGIVAAVEWQAKEFQKQTGIRCRINLPKQEIRLDETKSIVVFRVFQEILTNIARHANASKVVVNLDVDENNLILTVSDNGKGIKTEDITSKRSLGITGMKERASSVNGKLSIHGVSNIGTTVTLTIPIN